MDKNPDKKLTGKTILKIFGNQIKDKVWDKYPQFISEFK